MILDGSDTASITFRQWKEKASVNRLAPGFDRHAHAEPNKIANKKQGWIMNKKFALFFLLNIFAFSASAQWKATTKQECTKRCVESDAGNPRKTVFEEKLRQIREKKKIEQDDDKLQGLLKEEKQEIENYKDNVEKICTSICKGNLEAR